MSDHTASGSASTPPPLRIPRTHTSPTVIQLLKLLSLPTILQRNKQIETANEARSIKTLNHASDPVTYPEAGSPTASLITIEPEDFSRLRIPSFLMSVRDHIYSSLAKKLTDEELREREEGKRKTDPGVSADQLRVSKRRCMDGANQIERVVGEPVPIEFAQTLYDTELCAAIPLPFFLSKNLRTLIDESATLPTVKSNPLPGETKGIYILDVEKLSTRFGKELSLTCSQWSEAAGNMWDFQASRDKCGTDGDRAIWFEKHFNFFNRLDKREELYDAWKVVELEFRRDHRSRNLKFAAGDYDRALGLAEEGHKLRKEMQDLFAASRTAAPRPLANARGGNNSGVGYLNRNGRPSRFQSTSQPFPSGSGRTTSSSNSYCLICAEKGHNISLHIDSTHVKFLDRKAAWAKCSTGLGLVSPDNHPLCINWNVRGAGAGNCTNHGSEQVHLCSFCGSKGHHALSWTCRNSTA